MVRHPAVSGQFYSGSKDQLQRDIDLFTDHAAKKQDVIGVVSPHAGYVYSGPVAGAVLSSIRPKKIYIILGPNHTGLGEPLAIDANTTWKTPLGDVAIDTKVADRIIKNCKYATYDSLAHEHEHCIEVQIPFLQALGGDFTIVPIVVSYSDIAVCQSIGKSIARSIGEMKIEDDVIIIASSDMTHYESAEAAKKKDFTAIDAILKLDEIMLAEKVAALDISMCGYAPALIMLTAAKELGAKKARLIKYSTSGDTSGDYDSVVGYAGIIVY